MPSNFRCRFTISPKYRFASRSRSSKRARVDINYRQRLRRLNNHITARRQVYSRPQSFSNSSVDTEKFQNRSTFSVMVDQNSRRQFAPVPAHQLLLHPLNPILRVHHNPIHITAEHIPQHPLDKIVVAIQQCRCPRRTAFKLNSFPLFLQHLQIFHDGFFSHPFSFGAYQQPHPRRFNQNSQCSEAVALVFRLNPPREINSPTVGHQHQIAPRQSDIACQPGPFAARRFFHHLYQNFLLRSQEFCNCPCRSFEPQGAEIRDVHEPVAFWIANIYEGGIYPR